MGPMDLYFDVRDIFRAPRLALSGKKILIFIDQFFKLILILQFSIYELKLLMVKGFGLIKLKYIQNMN